jgi:transcriptional regulator with XRE-family HTH domain
LTQKIFDYSALADRIRYVRSLLGVTLNDFEKKFGIKKTTASKWEQGISPISHRFAGQLVDILASQNILCTIEWIIHGKGSLPKHITNDSTEKNIMPVDSGFEGITRDLDYYVKNYKNFITLTITDESMAPIFTPGCYVGGCEIDIKDIKNYLDKPCIVVTDDGKKRLRRIGLQKGVYFIYGINFSASGQACIEYDVKFQKVAPLIWMRYTLKDPS